ncbi:MULTISPECIES: DMT family transporter [Caldisericum]|uniref:DMT family transporter n=1 Tax=Caldisericum TaxID=693074 RepID=UPI003C71730C
MAKLKSLIDNFTFSILSLSLIWGSDYILIKIIIKSFHPILFVSLKLLIGAISIFIILKFILKRNIIFEKNALIFVLSAAFFDTFLPQILISFGERTVPSYIASLLLASSPIFALIFSILFTNEKLNYKLVPYFLFGFLGVFFIFFNEFIKAKISINILNLLLVAFASISYAIGVILLKKVSSFMDAFTSSFYLMIFGFLFSLIAIPIFKLPAPDFTYQSIFALIFAGVVLNGIGYAYFFYAISKFGAGKSSFVGYLVPFFSTLYGTLLLKEKLTIYAVLGGILILISSYFINRVNLKGD